jgi:glycosyltransferase involved in cell wall biosynthesis
MVPRLSFTIPVLNEQEVLPHLFSALLELRAKLDQWECEFIFVNDGSRDLSANLLDQFAQLHERVTIVHFSRNFGQQAAYSAGLSLASGDAVIMMDADLQDDPEQVLLLLTEFERGFDVVYGIRESREAGWLINRAYTIFYRILRSVSTIEIPADTGDFCVMSSRVAKEIAALPEVHRYLRGMRAWVGFRQKGVPLPRAARKAGVTKYSLRKLIRLALDAVFSFSLWPLRVSFLLGMSVMTFAGLFLLMNLLMWCLTDIVPSGYTTTIGFLILLSGLQFLLLGVIGEYIGRIFQQVKGRPVYVVARVVQKDH